MKETRQFLNDFFFGASKYNWKNPSNKRNRYTLSVCIYGFSHLSHEYSRGHIIPKSRVHQDKATCDASKDIEALSVSLSRKSQEQANINPFISPAGILPPSRRASQIFVPEPVVARDVTAASARANGLTKSSFKLWQIASL